MKNRGLGVERRKRGDDLLTTEFTESTEDPTPGVLAKESGFA